MSRSYLIYQNILKNMSDGVLTIGMDGRIMTVNNAAEKILDIRAEECLGRPYGEIFFLMEGNDDFNQLILDAVYESAVTHNRTVSFHTAAGVRTLRVSTSFLKPDEDARDTAVIVVMSDISELERTHQAERELTEALKQKHRELSDSYLRLEAANAGMTALLKKVQVIRIAATAFIIILFLAVGIFTWLQTGVRYGGVAAHGVAADGVAATPSQMTAQGEARQIFTVSYRSLSDTISLKSVIKPIRVVSVTCPFSGSIEDVFFEYGQGVTKGQLLLRMDKTEAEMQYREAYAAAIKAEETFRDFQNWEHNDQVVKARRSLARSKMSLDNYKKAFEETEYLFQKGFIPEQEYENARQQYANARLDYEAAEHELTIVRANGTGNNYEIARLEMENAKTKLAGFERRLSLADVVAPVAGTVMLAKNSGQEKSDTPIVSGAPVSEGDMLVSVGDTSGLSVTVNVDEIEVLKISQGQEARITGEAFPGITLKGRVVNVSTQANVFPGGYNRPTFSVLIAIEDISPEERSHIRLGITADVMIVIHDNPKAILVPIRAVITEGDERFVLLRDQESGAVRKVLVETGVTTLDSVEILKGLSAGDELIIG